MNYFLAEYIWLDSNQYPRSKTKVVYKDYPLNLEDLPKWNFDGSSTNQSQGQNSEVILKPVKIYPDPFRKNNHILVLCECMDPNGTPNIYNTRNQALNIFNNNLVKSEQPWYGIEQEYILMHYETDRPLGWPLVSIWDPQPQSNYYCSVGTENISGREIVEKHLKLCLDAKLNVSGINAEVMLGQWEYQIGPCEGIDASDELIISRYILYRVCEGYKVRVSLEPKPIKGNWNGSGCHTNFSTKSIREKDDAMKYIKEAMKKLETNHELHMKNYGKDNHLRMTGEHETASYHKFTYGLGNRAASIRIPSETKKLGKGYFEDRRPASNMDPYLVTSLLAKTILL